ncbi:hypothetical protein ES703_07547 [subsurface metagenome]
MSFFSTRQVARLLGISISRLSRAVWEGRVNEPFKGPGGSFLWTEKDIEHASWVLRHRSADDVLENVNCSQEALAV